MDRHRNSWYLATGFIEEKEKASRATGGNEK
jgi:hypothetical protein